MAKSLNRRFLTVMVELERHVLGSEDRNFKDAVFKLVGEGSLTSAQATDLEWMWDVRNLLTHNNVSGQDVVDVQPASVRAVERIRNQLTGRVPSVQGLVGDVAMTNPEESAASAAGRMARNDYSCLPVSVRGRVVGAIDGDMILHWVAEDLDTTGLLEDVTVGTLRGLWPEPHLTFMRSDCAQRDVVHEFKASLDRGTPLAAVLLTSDGGASGLVEGILTPWDIASLHT